MMKMQNRPELGPSETLEVVRDRFGLDGSLSPLPGERDRNYLLEGPAGSRHVVELHGSLEAFRCIECQLPFPADQIGQ